MSKSVKLIIGILSIWPFVYILMFFGFAIYLMTIFSLPGDAQPNLAYSSIFIIHILTIIETFGLITFYIINVFRNDRVNKDMKILWAIVLFLGSMIAMPIYWYLYIWRKPKEQVIQ
jgi:hypothetical protein